MSYGASDRPRFFLSHSMKDGPAVEMLRERIEDLGVDLYLAEHDPRPGFRLADKVIEAINESDAVVVLLTEAGAAAPFVQQEIGAARQAGKLIVPIVQAGVDTSMLAMLTGLERIEVDFVHPLEALAAVTTNLDPLVQRQIEELRSTTQSSGTQIPLPVLIGLGLLALALLFTFTDK